MSVPTLPPAAATGFANGVGDANNGPQIVSVTPTTTSAPASFTSTTTSVPTVSQTFTAADIERARAQEKDKLYPLIEELRTNMANLQKERDEREAAEKTAREAAEAEARRKTEEETDIRTLLQQKEQEWAQRLESEKAERERAIALLERERSYQAVQDYRAQRLQQESSEIIPELLDLVTGTTPEEIDASIAGLKERSTRILEAAQTATAVARQNMVGARVTAPAAGPLDTDTGQRQYTADEIAAMPMSEYSKHRGKLLGESTRNRGLFG